MQEMVGCILARLRNARNVSASDTLLLAPANCGGQRHDAIIDKDAWPACFYLLLLGRRRDHRLRPCR